MERQVARILVELWARGYSPDDVEYLRKRAQRETWVNLRELKAVTKTTRKKADEIARYEDFTRWAERTIEKWSEEAASTMMMRAGTDCTYCLGKRCGHT